MKPVLTGVGALAMDSSRRDQKSTLFLAFCLRHDAIPGIIKASILQAGAGDIESVDFNWAVRLCCCLLARNSTDRCSSATAGAAGSDFYAAGKLPYERRVEDTVAPRGDGCEPVAITFRPHYHAAFQPQRLAGL